MDVSNDIENRFTYHPPLDGQPEQYELIRYQVKQIAHLFIDQCPPSRELSIALTKLEEAVFWVNAGIARNPEDPF